MKTALVTGGSRGIGAALCYQFALKGYHVLINGRHQSESSDRLISHILQQGGSAELLEFDVADPTSIEQAKNRLNNRPIDVLINNAGILKDNLLPAIEFEDWQQILGTNFWGCLNVYQTFKANLKLAAQPVVINMGSISGVRPRAGQGAYAVSKSMVIEWTRKMAEQDTDIAFYSISPGPVATDMIKTAPWYNNPRAFDRIPMKRFAETEEIADLALMLSQSLAAPRSGSNLIIDGGFSQTTQG